jgi:predicted dehydrogenase
MAGAWIRHFFPPFAERVEIVGLVDVNPAALAESGGFLGLPADRLFTEHRAAFEAVAADFCCIVTPPACHEEAVMLAAVRGMDILSEKPIADTWEACGRIVQAVRQAGVRMMITQNYRYTPRILGFRQALAEQRLGRLNYLVARFAADYRQYGAWGIFRHEIPHALLVEGAIHHFDQLRNLAGADCQTICGYEWNPAWSSFKGESAGLLLMRFANGVPAHYEGNCSAVGEQNNWHGEYYRAECEGGAVVLGADNRLWFEQHTPGQGMTLTEAPLVYPRWEGHMAIVAQFLDWLDGGETPATVLEENLKSAAMMFGAMEASATGTVVDVEAMVRVALAG